MRLIYFLFLVVFVAAVGTFVVQNDHRESVLFLNQTREMSFPVLVLGAYVLGMLSGWTVVGMLRRSLRHVTADGRTVRVT
jgi:lipopolysaccharide assembly protein A